MWLSCKVPTSSSGALWGSMSCPRILWHAGRGNRTIVLSDNKALALPLSHSRLISCYIVSVRLHLSCPLLLSASAAKSDNMVMTVFAVYNHSYHISVICVFFFGRGGCFIKMLVLSYLQVFQGRTVTVHLLVLKVQKWHCWSAFIQHWWYSNSDTLVVRHLVRVQAQKLLG